MLVCYLVLENTQNLLNLISVNTNFLEAINQIDVCIGVEDEGKNREEEDQQVPIRIHVACPSRVKSQPG